MEPLKLLNTYRYWKDLPHQNAAILWLESQLTSTQLAEFTRRWREAPARPVVEMLMTPTERRHRGLIVFDLALMVSDRPVDRVSVFSGAPSAQVLLHPRQDYSGSLRPIPEGVWTIGAPEKSPIGSWGEGIGEWWVPLEPKHRVNNRTAIGIHLDANYANAPGSAGCIVTRTAAELQRILSWLWGQTKPTQLVVDYGTGYLAEIGYRRSSTLTGQAWCESHLRDDQSIVAIAVGVAEGNRTPTGGYTQHYRGHTDPGNQRRNLGSFSYQGRASSPQEADRIWLDKLRRELVPRYLQACQKAKIPPENLFLFVNACDLFTQAPLAAVDKGGLLEQFPISDEDEMIKARVKSFYNPHTGRLEAAGFGNDVRRLTADQSRRVNALMSVIRRRS